MKSDIKVVGRWKSKGGRKIGESVNIKKMSKCSKIIEKLEKKKKDSDVDADVAKLKYSNNKCYDSAFRYIYIYIYIERERERERDCFVVNEQYVNKCIDVVSMYIKKELIKCWARCTNLFVYTMCCG